jgi:Protein of unknown function (DUF4232)
MEPKSKSDRILEEWNAVSETARRPVQAPHGSPDRSHGSVFGLIGAGLLAAALVVAVAWLGGRTSTGVGASPSPSSSDAAAVESASPTPEAPSASPEPSPSVEPSPSSQPSATPAPTPTPVPTVGPCTAKGLSARITSWEGAAGNRIAQVTMTNSGSATCTMLAATIPQLVDGRGTVLAQGTGKPGGHELTLKPGDVLNSQVDVTNVCKTPVVAPVTIAYDLGGGRRVVSKPQSQTDSTVPPCNGPGQPAAIGQHPWAP